MQSHNEDVKEEADDDLPPESSKILPFRRTYATDGYCLTKEGIITPHAVKYDLDDTTNQDLKDYINPIEIDDELKELLTIENIKEKTGITDEKDLQHFSQTCGQIFFQLLSNDLLTPENLPKTIDRLLSYDITALEEVADRLKEPDRTQSLDDILSVNLVSEESYLSRLSLYARKVRTDEQEKTFEPPTP